MACTGSSAKAITGRAWYGSVGIPRRSKPAPVAPVTDLCNGHVVSYLPSLALLP